MQNQHAKEMNVKSNSSWPNGLFRQSCYRKLHSFAREMIVLEMMVVTCLSRYRQECKDPLDSQDQWRNLLPSLSQWILKQETRTSFDFRCRLGNLIFAPPVFGMGGPQFTRKFLLSGGEVFGCLVDLDRHRIEVLPQRCL